MSRGRMDRAGLREGLNGLNCNVCAGGERTCCQQNVPARRKFSQQVRTVGARPRRAGGLREATYGRQAGRAYRPLYRAGTLPRAAERDTGPVVVDLGDEPTGVVDLGDDPAPAMDLNLEDMQQLFDAAAATPDDELNLTPAAARTKTLVEQEVFMEKSLGQFECKNCLYIYDESMGDAKLSTAPGTKFADLPSNFRCPRCFAGKDMFYEKKMVIPGFEVNKTYGFGTNEMSAGQKSGLIFGGLVVFFVLFLSGYLME